MVLFIASNIVWLLIFLSGGLLMDSTITTDTYKLLLSGDTTTAIKTTANPDETIRDTSKNEQQYDKKYWEWQASMNKFGAAYKGDIIRHILAGMPRKPETILEFGCSGGYILDSMPVAQKYGVEINPAARAHAQTTFPSIQQVFLRPEDIPETLRFDVIYSTSVFEHVDCPLCELRKLKHKLKDDGIFIVGLKNDGADPGQEFASRAHDPNHHIYTWNALLLANMMDSAGYTPCQSTGQYDAWHNIDVDQYKADKYKYCKTGLAHGKQNHVQNLWSVSVNPQAAKALCGQYAARVQEILDCKYLKLPNNEKYP